MLFVTYDYYYFKKKKQQATEDKGPEKIPISPKLSTTETLKEDPGFPATSRIRICGESIRQDSPFKAVFITSSTTCEEVVQLVLTKYNSTDDPQGYALYIDDKKSGGGHLSFCFRCHEGG